MTASATLEEKNRSPAAYGYRDDPAVRPFDDGRPLVIFDGLCVLCSTGVRWMLRRDPKGESRFATIQSAAPRALYLHYGLDPDRFDTFMVLADGVAHVRWAGVLAAARTMPAPWRWLASIGALIPKSIGDRIYDWVQRNRLRWFGSHTQCLVPSADVRRRFLDETPAASWPAVRPPRRGPMFVNGFL